MGANLMADYHPVAPGECITSISGRYGFYWRTLWDHGLNGQLKERREDPNTLVPGDAVYIPDKREKEESVNTGALHKFKLRGMPAVLRLQMFDGEEYRANQEYTVTVGRERHTGTTDENGVLEVPVPPDARKAKLIIGDDQAVYEINIGNLPPIGTLEGVQTRLCNLGFYSGEIDGLLNEGTRQSLTVFQQRFDLQETGEPDDPTKDKLVEMHDKAEDFPEEEEEAGGASASSGQ